MRQDEGIVDFILGIIFGTGVGFCVIGLVAAVLWGFFPDYALSLLALAGR